ncbi:ESCRT-II complex subunit-domain-containing protein [Pilobolus umbonatus]|nr:ESCRT-II complex subunit-domain-containing protein [Pilobolus umbonatus]
MDISYPPLYSFPPFFTKQITETTWKNQARQWESLILDYARHCHIVKMDLREYTSPGGYKIFENPSIDRRLSFETLQDIIEEMVKRGSAEWVSRSKTEAWIYWHSLEEWADRIWNWVQETGQNNQIVTFYEITHGDLAEGQEFFELDPDLIYKALSLLVKKGHAQIFNGNDEENRGVKFLK